MADFMIRFLICNVFISGIIGILLIAKRIFKGNLSSRMQYNLWFLLLGLLVVPFIPFRLIGFPQILSWLSSLKSSPTSGTRTAIGEAVGINPAGNADWMNDFALSVNSETPSSIGYILFGIWLVGILAMIILVIKSSIRLQNLKKSALPLQNPEVRKLYHRCMKEMGINRNLHVYSTAFLKSPIIVGLLKPCIYLPIHLISDYNESDMRYMLLHELQHYKHKDAIANYLMNFAGVIYWFNPLVWYALKEMRNDREVACDTSVLKMLEEDDYADYGNTLINFAEKISLTPFPFAAGLGGNMKQMKRRIINIASYEKPTFIKRVKGMTAFMLTAVLLLGLLWSSFFVTLVAKKIVLINLCCRPCFIWGSITIITVWTNMIIINVCKFFYLLIECFLCCKLIQICAFILQGIEVTLHRCIVVRISCFAHALCHIYRFAEFGKCFGRIL